ncbi:unnamed protein product [Cercospora beticola]|nr:unnamed protein product [Cercospora beticola]
MWTVPPLHDQATQARCRPSANHGGLTFAVVQLGKLSTVTWSTSRFGACRLRRCKVVRKVFVTPAKIFADECFSAKPTTTMQPFPKTYAARTDRVMSINAHLRR